VTAGEKSDLSVVAVELTMNAEFGAELATGVGSPEFDVTQEGAPALAVQPAGSAGAATPSKF
jgi:hypothetical protein